MCSRFIHLAGYGINRDNATISLQKTYSDVFNVRNRQLACTIARV
jgi:hypothetical protein